MSYNNVDIFTWLGSKTTILTPSEIFGSNYYDDWDFGDLSTVSESSGLINSIVSKGMNGNIFTAPGLHEPSLVYDADLDKYVADFDGVSEYMNIASSTGDYNFLHNGDGGMAIIIWRASAANPNDVYLLLSNALSTTEVGVLFSYDDRASFSRNNALLLNTLCGVGGDFSSRIVTANNVVTTQEYNSTSVITDSDNATASERLKYSTNLGSLADGNTFTASASLSNSSRYLTISDSSNPFYGKIARIIVIDTIPTTQQLSDLENYLIYYYGNFPI